MFTATASFRSRPGEIAGRLRHLFATFILSAVCCGLSTIPATTAVSAEDPRAPNIVLILADDLGYADIGCYGSKQIKTPHLDALAAAGLRFTDFHSSGAVCSPTRAGLLTGRYQQRAGIPSVIFADPKRPTHPHGIQDREVTFAELFAAAGYQTAIFGKWHLGYYKKYNPVRHGFAQFRGYVSGNVDFFSHIDQAGRLDWWRDDTIDDEPGYTTHLITRHALAFIEANRNKPFCLYLPYEPPHYPYQGPGDKPLRVAGRPRGKSESRQSPAEVKRAYKEMVEAMDDGIGQLIAAVKRLGIERRTLVIFSSDNGANARGNNGRLRGFKGQVWEGGHRVPCIAWWPGTIKAGGVSDQLAISLDFMPTILDAAKIDLPQDHKLDGVSLLPLFRQNRNSNDGLPNNLQPRQLFWQHGNAQAVRDGPWKLVANVNAGRRPDKQPPRLYNLTDDLSEQNDVSEQQTERVKRMQAALKAWQRDVARDAAPQPAAPPR